MAVGLAVDAQALARKLDAIEDPWEQLETAVRAAPGRTALGTSGQLTGTAIIEGSHQRGIDLRVYTVDTLRLFPETYSYFDTLEAHYELTVERFRPDPEAVAKMVRQHGEYLFFDSKAKQEHCCELRKVNPNNQALSGIDIWISGLRRDQSPERSDTPRVQILDFPDPESDEIRPLIKLAPLAHWREADVRAFLAEHDAPVHPLLADHDSPWFYESLGCVICTTPQAQWEPRRAGRWRWFNQQDQDDKECGIHVVDVDARGGL